MTEKDLEKILENKIMQQTANLEFSFEELGIIYASVEVWKDEVGSKHIKEVVDSIIKKVSKAREVLNNRDVKKKVISDVMEEVLDFLEGEDNDEEKRKTVA